MTPAVEGPDNEIFAVCLLEMEVFSPPGDVLDDDIESQVHHLATFTLSCEHSFHKKCITDWVQRKEGGKAPNNCPLCRKRIEDVLHRVLNPNYESRQQAAVIGRPRAQQIAPQQMRMEERPPRIYERICEEPVTVLQERTTSAFQGAGLGFMAGVGGAAVVSCCSISAMPNVFTVAVGGACVGTMHGCCNNRDTCGHAMGDGLLGGTAGLGAGLIGWGMFPVAGFTSGIAAGASGGAILACISGAKIHSKR